MRLREYQIMKISIPSGAIKRFAGSLSQASITGISIPSGAIKSFSVKSQLRSFKQFQFLLVRLRAACLQSPP